MHGEFDVKSTGWISEGYSFFKENFKELFPLFIIAELILIAASSVVAGNFILQGPIACSVFYAIFMRMRGGKVEINYLGEGFKVFVPSLIANLLMTLFTAVGLVLCIIPGIIISAFYIFTLPLIIDKKLDFWEAMETSRKAVSTDIFGFIIFLFLLFCLQIVGVLLCVIGLLFTIPIAICSMAIAYREIFGIEGDLSENPQQFSNPDFSDMNNRPPDQF